MPLWAPLKVPPDPRTISDLSSEAEMVWQAILLKDKRHEENRIGLTNSTSNRMRMTTGTCSFGLNESIQGASQYGIRPTDFPSESSQKYDMGSAYDGYENSTHIRNSNTCPTGSTNCDKNHIFPANSFESNITDQSIHIESSSNRAKLMQQVELKNSSDSSHIMISSLDNTQISSPPLDFSPIERRCRSNRFNDYWSTYSNKSHSTNLETSGENVDTGSIGSITGDHGKVTNLVTYENNVDIHAHLPMDNNKERAMNIHWTSKTQFDEKISHRVSEETLKRRAGGRNHKDNNEPKQKSKKSFQVPLKQTSEKFNPGIRTTKKIEINECARKKCNLEHASTMSDDRLSTVGDILLAAEEVALTLVFQDGSSQLRKTSHEDKKAKSPRFLKAKGIVIAYPGKKLPEHTSTQLGFIELLFDNGDDTTSNWARQIVHTIMKRKCRKLCFDAQRLIQTLTEKMDFPHNSVCVSWRNILDPRIAGWLINSDTPPETFEQVLGDLKNIKQMDSPVIEERLCTDLSLLGPVMFQLYHKLNKMELWPLFTTVEMTLCPLLSVMNLSSIKINTREMVETGDILKSKLDALEIAAHKAAGHSFLINSHVQLRQILFEELKLDCKHALNWKTARTGGNKKSTSEAVLSQLEHLHPLPRIVLDYRQVSKLKSTFIDGLLANVKGDSLQTIWDHTAAVTGRLTSTNPNVQAIPKQPITIKLTQDSLIRGRNPTVKTFDIHARSPLRSRDGWSFLSADFQQIEFRILGHLANDQTLKGMFLDPNSKDIFVELTSMWLGKPANMVTATEREQSKRVVYSVMYGAGKDKLSEYLKISPIDAGAIIQSFLVKFPCLNSFTRKCIEETRAQGYQTTIFKRRRYLPHINHSNSQLRAQSERQAVNFCIQGSAADICKAAMINVMQAFSREGFQTTRLLLQIHDELLFEVPDKDLIRVSDIVKNTMEDTKTLCGNITELTVPLKVSMLTGKSWGNLQ